MISKVKKAKVQKLFQKDFKLPLSNFELCYFLKKKNNKQKISKNKNLLKNENTTKSYPTTQPTAQRNTQQPTQHPTQHPTPPPNHTTFKPTDRTRLNEMRAMKNLVCNTPKASSANAERIEQASQKVEKRSRTSRSWFEGVSVERVCKVMSDTVRKCAWQITRRLARPGRMKQVKRPCGRSHNGQVSEFTELYRFREPQKADEWSSETVEGHGHGFKRTLEKYASESSQSADPSGDAQRINAGTESRSTEMNGEPWNTPPRQEEKLQIQDRECTALKQQIKCGGQKSMHGV